eukprot:1144256-Pelagomonas_calceolata.AAC.4
MPNQCKHEFIATADQPFRYPIFADSTGGTEHQQVFVVPGADGHSPGQKGGTRALPAVQAHLRATGCFRRELQGVRADACCAAASPIKHNASSSNSAALACLCSVYGQFLRQLHHSLCACLGTSRLLGLPHLMHAQGCAGKLSLPCQSGLSLYHLVF